MEENRLGRARAFFEVIKAENEEDIRSVGEFYSGPVGSVLFSPNNLHSSDLLGLSNITSPVFHNNYLIESNVNKQEQIEGLAALYDEKNQAFSLGNLFGGRTLQESVVLPQQPKSDSGDEDDDEEASDSGKRKFNKGLKLLSVIVQDIVAKKQSTTYKEVANIILDDSIKSGNLPTSSKIELAKEEQNIKRRVYDALNVLISAGILLKEGKKVRKNDVNKKIKISSKLMTIKSLKSTLQQKKTNLELMKKNLDRTSHELECLKRLIARNKKEPSQKYIAFPFFVVKPSPLENTDLKIQKQVDCQKFALYSNHEFNIYGDMEVVAMINPTVPNSI